ncbi:MAG: hypothetical protein J2P48_21865, partial [Alphaproteobacteria bacterium]|nr:hypothetical protein [Alphaproteobacteria bacterium]
PLTVLVVPHGSQLAWIDIARPRAILFIADPEEAIPLIRGSLCDDFGLTPAEARLAREMLKGDGLRGVSDRLSISLATAHTQLARVFDKYSATIWMRSRIASPMNVPEKSSVASPSVLPSPR